MSERTHRSIRFIYFDLDDTLLDHSSAEMAALRDLHTEYSSRLRGISFATMHARYREINRDVWHRYSDGDITKQEAKRLRFMRLANAIGLHDPTLVEELPTAYLRRYSNHWKPIKQAFETFMRLAAQVEVGILTNGFAEIQRAKLERFPELKTHSSRVVISEEVGTMKPDPAIFAHSTRSAGVEPDEVLYVGDSLRSDVEGGRSFGWHVAWYNGRNNHRSDVFCFTEWQHLLRHAEDRLAQ